MKKSHIKNYLIIVGRYAIIADSLLLFFVLYGYMHYFLDKPEMQTLTISYIYASLFYEFQNLVLGRPIKVYSLFIVLGVIPAILIGLTNILVGV